MSLPFARFVFVPMRVLSKILVGVLSLWPVVVGGQGMDQVLAKVQADLKQATEDLSAARAAVGEERLPLARRITELEQRLLTERAELARAQRAQENQLVELNALKAEARRLSEETKYIDSLLTEYARAFRSRLNFVEEPHYAALLEGIDKAATAADLSPADRFTGRAVLLTRALERADRASGGELMEGKALDSRGLVQKGRVALIGPVAMFASASGEVAGLLQQELNRADPTIAQLDPALTEASRTLVTTSAGELVLDPTLGNAFRLSALKESLFEKFEKGGIVMIPLLCLGFSALILALLKWLQFARVRLASESDLQAVLRHLAADEVQRAEEIARGFPGLVGDLLSAAVAHAGEKKEYIEEVLYEKMLGARTKLERGLSFLALTATTGPLLGLLGTVTGMIATFKLISSFGSGDPKMLASGISEALIATATGMGVAIPALLFHAFLARRAKSIIGRMEQIAVGFVNGVKESDEDVVLR